MFCWSYCKKKTFSSDRTSTQCKTAPIDPLMICLLFSSCCNFNVQMSNVSLSLHRWWVGSSPVWLSLGPGAVLTSLTVSTLRYSLWSPSSWLQSVTPRLPRSRASCLRVARSNSWWHALPSSPWTLGTQGEQSYQTTWRPCSGRSLWWCLTMVSFTDWLL